MTRPGAAQRAGFPHAGFQRGNVLISAHDRPGVVGLAVMPGQGDPGRGEDVHRGGAELVADDGTLAGPAGGTEYQLPFQATSACAVMVRVSVITAG